MIHNSNKYFDFLIDLGFKGPFEYYYVREIHTNYVKGNIVVNIIFEGSFWVYVIKTKKYIPELESGTKRIIDLDFSEYKSYDLFDLDPKRYIYNSVEFNNQTEKDLWFFSKLIKDNSEILNGNFKEFNMIKYILRKTGIIKQ
jgi:hypothetical protein